MALALITGASSDIGFQLATLFGKREVGDATPAAPATVASVKEDVQQVKAAGHDRS